MPLFELTGTDELVPFQRLHASPEEYSREIGDLVWKSSEEIVGEPLFRVAHRPSLPVGTPDVVALDEQARVVVVSVMRDVGREELAEALEFAGWARTVNLDDLAAIYHRGREAFFGDWQAFTDSTASQRLRRPPRLILVARGFDSRTEPAFDFLVENSLPVRALRLALYGDLQGRRYVDIEGDQGSASAGAGATHGGTSAPEEAALESRGIRLPDLLEAGYVSAGERLVWARPGTGEIYYATVTDNGCVELADGRTFSGPSRAAAEAAEIPAFDGWQAWRVGGSDGELLDQRRARYIRRAVEIDTEPTSELEDEHLPEPAGGTEVAADGPGEAPAAVPSPSPSLEGGPSANAGAAAERL